MRCKNLSIHLYVAVPKDPCDENGVFYTEESVRKACENGRGVPFVQRNDAGDEVPVGIVNSMEYSNGIITIKGCGFYGGTQESVEIENGKVVSMNFTGVSLSQ